MSQAKESYAVTSVKAFIERDGKILILRESPTYRGGANHGKFVLPGGKVHVGEHFRDALKREVQEETGLLIEVGGLFHVDEWFPNVPGKPSHTVAIFFVCSFRGEEVKHSKEFDEYLWVVPAQYKDYDLNDAARRAFVTYIQWKKKH